MKKLLFITLIIPYLAYTQASETPNEYDTSSYSFKPQFLLYLKHHDDFGDNFLAEANESDFVGFGLQINLLKLHDFKAGIGGEYMKYDVTDIQKAGNIEQTFSYSIFTKFQYQYDLWKKWSVEPNIGIGATRIHQKTESRSFGDFYGIDYYLGSNFTYKFVNHFSVFFGISYNYTHFNVDTHETHESFFRNSHKIKTFLGLIFTVDNH